jgi:hypothetical protein
MNTKMDLKSALAGLGLGFLGALAIGAASPAPPIPIGRYQVAGTGDHGLILDTATGQAWRAFLSAAQGITDGDFFTPKVTVKK